jgi:hypothetical protein
VVLSPENANFSGIFKDEDSIRAKFYKLKFNALKKNGTRAHSLSSDSIMDF